MSTNDEHGKNPTAYVYSIPWLRARDDTPTGLLTAGVAPCAILVSPSDWQLTGYPGSVLLWP